MAATKGSRKHLILYGDKLERDRVISGDVAVVGTGAGGGVAAEILARAGLKVLMVEEGPYQTMRDFHMQEAEAYPQLYQEVASRKTRDKAVTILQGRAVGGSTTVNWTSCFHIPARTLVHWTERFGLRAFSVDDLEPWFARMEQRFKITPWAGRNPSNEVFHRGARKLGWHAAVIARNVYRCRNLGYCGLGCPVDAKQSTLVTSIPAALDRGAVLLSRVRAVRLRLSGDRASGLDCIALDARGADPTGVRVRVDAGHIVLAGGGINTPVLLLRSKAPDPYGLIGRRTFLHVTTASAAVMPEKINPFYGAPQSVHSNEFLWRDGVTGKMGYKLEVAPLHPALAAIVFKDYGSNHADIMRQISHINPMIALMRDGFHEDSPGGVVSLTDDGSPVLDYPVNDYLWEGVRHAYLSMAECQYAAGAKFVKPVHTDARAYSSWTEASRAIPRLPMKAHHAVLFSAHVMGGCAMGEDPRSAVVNSLGAHHQLVNVSIMDGSIFPSSIGANPTLPIFAVAARQANELVARLGGRKAAPV